MAKKGAHGGQCATTDCANPSQWIPIGPREVRDRGEYYCESCCEKFGRAQIKVQSYVSGVTYQVISQDDTHVTVQPPPGEPGEPFAILKSQVTEVPEPHKPRPDDDPEPGDRCKDCGKAVTWIGPSQYDWEHVN